jgi:hypothetical protein
MGSNFQQQIILTQINFTTKNSTILNIGVLFSIFSLVAILVGSRNQQTQFWKRAIQIPFHQSLVAIGPVVSEEKIKVYDVAKNRKKGG